MMWYFDLFGIELFVDWVQVLVLTLALLIASLLGYILGFNEGKTVTDEAWREYYRSGQPHND